VKKITFKIMKNKKVVLNFDEFVKNNEKVSTFLTKKAMLKLNGGIDPPQYSNYAESTYVRH
jgi:hypothetical protein